MSKLIDLNGWRGMIVLIALGSFSALAFPPTYCIVILFFTLPVLIRRTERVGNWKQAFFQGYWFGFGLHTIGLSWLVNAVLIRAQDFWWLVPVVSPLCAVLLALWTGLATLLYYWISPTGWKKPLLFAGLWTICDMSRGILLPPEWWNPILTGFPWNPLGSSWEFPGAIGDLFIQPASVIGVDGLTLLTVLLALCPLCGRKGLGMIGIIMIVWLGFGWLRLSPSPMGNVKTPIIAMVQGNIAEDDKIANTDPCQIFQTYMDLTRKGVQQAVALRQKLHLQRPIIFAWPESSFPGNILQDGMARSILMRDNPQADLGILGAVTFDDREHLYNSLVLLNKGQGDIKGQYHKSKLVPFGESQPWYIPFHLVPGMVLTAGQGNQAIHYPAISPFEPLICYEVIFSGQVIQSGNRPQWILNITNDAWYGNSAGPRQHLAAARLRAVEEGLPVVRVANTGISAVFDPYGREISRIGWGQKDVAAIALPGGVGVTVFGCLSRWMPFLLAILCIISGLDIKNFWLRFRQYL